jgi:ribulose-phosphate 3-epimerase
MSVLVAPSILSADFARLGDEIRAVTAAGADWIHVDVMDGRFVPVITLGPEITAAVRRHTHLPLDVHLMIVEPERHIEAFARAGASLISVHLEACPHLHMTLRTVRTLGCQAGVAINPGTPASALDAILDDGGLDLVLVMTVNPGWGGQGAIPAAMKKVKDVRRMLDERGLASVRVEVDGGVKPDNARDFAPADVLVAGSAVFGAQDYGAAIRAIRAGGSPAT